MSLIRSQYEKIQDSSKRGASSSDRSRSAPTSPTLYQYGSLSHTSIQDEDPENPLSSSDVRVTYEHFGAGYEATAEEGGGRRKRMFWWGLAPALVLLAVVAGITVITGGFRMRQRSELPAVPDTGAKKVVVEPAVTVSPLPLHPPVMKPIEGAALSARLPQPEAPETSQPVMGCLEFQCRGLTQQLTQAWNDFSNIGLLRCLASAAANKTAGSDCFQTAGPSDLRNNLVACAGCNGCITLKDQDQVDKACDKYDTWAGIKTTTATVALPPAPEDFDEEEEAVMVVSSPRSSSVDDTSSSSSSTKTTLDNAMDHVKGKIDSIIDSATGQVDQTKEHSKQAKAQADETATHAKTNNTAVLSCLEDKCKPLTTQLVQTWKDLANIQLLRCLASAAVNQTAAGVCFDSAHPSELRDNLVACAGCNGCVTVKDKANIDKACAKYDAWKAKQNDDTTTTTTITTPTAALLNTFGSGNIPGQEADAATTQTTSGSDSTAAGVASRLGTALPKDLQAKYCSRYWCP